MRWREALGALYDVMPVTGADADAAFSASAVSLHLGPLVLGAMRADTLSYERSEARIRLDRLDHFILAIDQVTDLADGSTPSSAIVIQDLAQPLTLPATAWNGVCIVLPRDMMAPILPRAHLMHGARITGAMVAVLAVHVQSLLHTADTLTLAQAPALARATQQMIAACLTPVRVAHADGREALAVRAVLFSRAKRLIEDGLADPAFTLRGLAVALGISRSALYDLFVPSGGVARYITARRLDRIHAMLADPAEHRHIAEIAHDFGFTSEAHFSRAFRRRFGYVARDIRGRGFGRASKRLDPEAEMPPHVLFSHWVSDLD